MPFGGWESWRAFYQSDLQGLYALLVVPALFLPWLLLRGRRRVLRCGRAGADWLRVYALVFAAETLLDLLLTGAPGKNLGLGAQGAQRLQLLFVWLGDFRVFLLVFGLIAQGPLAMPAAALATFLVPLTAGALHFGVVERLAPGLPGQLLWLAYELLFLAMALWLRARVVTRLAEPEPHGRRAFLRRVLSYVALYYGLWAGSDLLILAGLDAGWALRVLPNQLYYAFWVPFVFLSFTSRSR